jgi:hypothetical protein
MKKNSYKVIFRSEWEIVDEATVEYKALIPLPSDPQKTWYTFKEWKNLPADGRMIADNLELQAQYTANTWTAYTVVYELEDLDINGIYNETW